ncbi:MAG TPA: PilZ domain-containing protein [Sandaracinaceae bacterium LLY-WYZ-13_1]|nr:PilZ domain-containing protein [Sandaracinaceae bacterium LLY-WYZ-13_1]
MGEERREAKRYVLWIPVQVSSGEDVPQMLAVSRNISWSGALMIAGASLELGRRVTLELQVPGEDARELEGEIVRVEPNEEDPEGLWRYRLAVRFDAPVPELEPAFERLENEGAPLE